MNKDSSIGSEFLKSSFPYSILYRIPVPKAFKVYFFQNEKGKNLIASLEFLGEFNFS